MNFSPTDHRHMALALRLARRGLNTTPPNPAVGCVIVNQGEVVGTGLHEYAGGPHAEVNALVEAGSAARGGTAYVTLEPCSHQGRTPPCAEALIEAGVAEVVMAVSDPNPRVSGEGRRRLEAAGVHCREGLMAAEAESLCAGFFKRMRTGLPRVRVKLAQSMDGRTALANGDSQWISSAASREDVQSWRARSSAILTGIGTLLADDPSLNVRLPGVQRQPLRVIADSRWRTPASARTLHLDGPVLIAGMAARPVPEGLAGAGAELLRLPGEGEHVDLASLMKELAAREVNDVHVEAGGALCGALLSARLVDEVLIYQAPTLLGGEALPSFVWPSLERMEDRPQMSLQDVRHLGPDLRIRLQPQYPEV